MGPVASKLRFLSGNAASDTTTLEGRIAAGLAPYRGSSPYSSVYHLASGIAFIIRYKLGPHITGEQVLIIANLQEPDDSSFIVYVHQGPKKMKAVLQASVKDIGDIIAEMSKTVDMAVFQAICSRDAHNSKSLVEELDEEVNIDSECKPS
ncbi:hypothetical protein HBI80_148090 [Parastagonospora nodorum]|nr:hypothetical protein HBI80_148090 [Parastagonospora nodorum]KAH5181519.1 hypothetical protein HBH76_161910 [Parastagonospora nodorum]KAH5307777.1 hypothetical protein HBI11_111840 [Parastagonospora nodorum]KAH6060018.1 hypothetical protein HBI66_201100 [Parastagonospora nodorum]KAH6060194.1 hypothetical protein HBI67_161680 [Parastagonospora nodorum]